jgi:hypothetical protein
MRTTEEVVSMVSQAFSSRSGCSVMLLICENWLLDIAKQRTDTLMCAGLAAS